jgi:hypothetical protein
VNDAYKNLRKTSEYQKNYNNKSDASTRGEDDEDYFEDTTDSLPPPPPPLDGSLPSRSKLMRQESISSEFQNSPHLIF